ncbi:hypothetical protein L2K70_17240 [Nocardioides KLBMP 9356]|uniref:DUF4386 family protein n=1 Tax=Nocardioides potassii TaxID=2911371 RepID=A0ABS9HDU1_9ACTN|nr:hypothetical protein [Nocardioides potassii]MCF6379360.1 hypothetical protein [Nocardioides potassii]
MTQQITMGAGLTAPEGTFAAGEAASSTSPSQSPTLARRLLAASAVAAPALFTAYVATDPAPLPREPAVEFIGAIAAHPTAFIVSTSFQFAAMAAGVTLAAYVMVAFARTAPRLAPVVGVLLGLGYLGGAAFAGAKTVAADLVVNGAPRAGALEVWSAVHTGPLFEVLSWPLLMAIPGNLLLAVLLLRNRTVVGTWPAVVVVVGFVMGSGEFPDVVTLTGWAIQVPAVLHVVRRTLRG